MIAQKQKVKLVWQTPKDINNKKVKTNFGQKYMNRIWYKNEQTKMEEKKNINILNIVRFDKLKSKLRQYDSTHLHTYIHAYRILHLMLMKEHIVFAWLFAVNWLCLNKTCCAHPYALYNYTVYTRCAVYSGSSTDKYADWTDKNRME